MNVLLDTHAFLWWVTNDPRLSTTASEVIAEGDNLIYLSTATAWEIAIKARLGRLRLPADPDTFIRRQLELNSFQVLPIELSHALHVFTLPDHHRDPFDRILIAQTQVESLILVTADVLMRRYDVQTLW